MGRTAVGIVSSDLIAGVAARVGAALDVAFEDRSSTHWGDPYYASLPPAGSLRLTENADPMYLPGKEPPDERFFVPEARDCNYILWCEDEWDAGAAGVVEQLRHVGLSARVVGREP